MNKSQPIILVEDDETIRTGLCEFLESEGYQVIAAENGQRGLEAIRSSQGVCLVLLDLQMPVMTGEQLLETLALEESANVRSVPVLVLTARGEGFRHSGIVGMVRKPVDLDDLLKKISPFCG